MNLKSPALGIMLTVAALSTSCGETPRPDGVVQTGADQASLSRMVAATNQLRTLRFHGHLSSVQSPGNSSDPLGTSVKASFEGARDNEGHQEEMTATLQQYASTKPPHGGPTLAPGDVTRTVLTAQGGFSQEVRSGAFRTKNGRRWASQPWATFDAPGAMMDAFGGYFTSDFAAPDRMLDRIRSLPRTVVSDRGSDDVAGVQTRHLHIDHNGGATSASTGHTGPGSDCDVAPTQIDLWAYQDGVIRRLEFRADFGPQLRCVDASPQNGAPVTMTVELAVDYTDFNKPLTIATPDPSDTYPSLSNDTETWSP